MKQILLNQKFQRTNKIIRRKFYQYLLPSVLTVAATSLNEFLDSIVVAQILGRDAMSMVNMASPVVFVFATICVLLGVGGSTVYASLKGKMEKTEASSVFSLTMLITALSSMAILIAGLCFLQQIVNLLSNDLAVPGYFTDYVRVLFISAPLIMVLQVGLMFLPAEGKPQITTIINIIANVVNIIFDIILTTIGQMQVTGAAWATLIGYIVGILFLLGLLYCGKCTLPFGTITKRTFRFFKEIIGIGAAATIGQFGIFVKVLFSNYIAALYAGGIGIAVFSACNQTVSIVSIFLGGLLSAMIPLLAVLHSKGDNQGIQALMQNVLKMEILISVALFLFMEVFPVQVLHLYGIEDVAGEAMGIFAIQIFSIMFLFRQTVMTFIYYAQTIGRKLYAVILGVLEGFVGIVALTEVFSHIIGINGLWISYPLCSALLMVGIFIVNRRITKKSAGRLKGFLLLPTDSANASELYFSLQAESGNISKFTEYLMEELKMRGVDDRRAYMAALACEELSVYTIEQDKKHRQTIDVLIRIHDADVSINFCSIGPVFSLLSIADKENFSNIYLLNKIAKKFEHDYILGMNHTNIII